MKTQNLLVFMALATALSACSKNDEVLAFIKDNDALAADLKAKAESEGPEAVTKALDAKRDDLKARFAALKGARGFQVSKENQAALMKSVTRSTMTVCGLSLKAIGDREKAAAYSAACRTYSAIFR